MESETLTLWWGGTLLNPLVFIGFLVGVHLLWQTRFLPNRVYVLLAYMGTLGYLLNMDWVFYVSDAPGPVFPYNSLPFRWFVLAVALALFTWAIWSLNKAIYREFVEQTRGIHYIKELLGRSGKISG